MNWILLELRIFQIYQLTEKIKSLEQLLLVLLSIIYQFSYIFYFNRFAEHSFMRE